MDIDYAVNVKTVLDRASEADRAAGLAWYPYAQTIAADMANGDVWKGAGVIAAFSPRQDWDLNILQARRAFAYGTAAGHKPALHTKQQVKSADMVMRGHWPLDVFKGDKTRAFTVAVATGGDYGIAVIDRHAHDVAMGHFDFTDTTRNIGKRLYRNMAAAYAEVADYTGMRVHDVQAITWVTWRREKKTAADLLAVATDAVVLAA